MNHIFLVNATVSGERLCEGEPLYREEGGATLDGRSEAQVIRAMSLLAAHRTDGFT